MEEALYSDRGEIRPWGSQPVHMLGQPGDMEPYVSFE